MLEKITIARPYAQAAFEFAREQDDVERWSEMLTLLRAVISNPDMRPLLHDPRVSDEQLYELVAGIAGDVLSEHGSNFVRVLIRAQRLQYLPEIADLFEASLAAAEGRVDVEVIAAYSLEENQEGAISAAMAKRLGKKISISAAEQEALIGGAIIRAGDSVIDASIRGRLNELKNELL